MDQQIALTCKEIVEEENETFNRELMDYLRKLGNQAELDIIEKLEIADSGKAAPFRMENYLWKGFFVS